MMQASAESLALKQDISALERKRQILEQIVDITHAIECMQDSLNAVSVMGVASKDLPEEALQLYSAISSMRNQPINKLKEYHANLEIIVKKELTHVLNYSGIDFSDDDQVEFITLSSEADAQSPVELLHAFKRTAQTAVSLRILLRKRGVPTAGSVLPVSTELLKERLNHLNQEEGVQRGRIKNQIEVMQADLVRMLDHPNYPEAMKAMFRDVVENLDKDLQLLARGAAVDRLSFVAETEAIEIGNMEEAVIEEITLEAAAPAEQAPANSGFSKTAIRWLNSPWDVSWDELQQQV